MDAVEALRQEYVKRLKANPRFSLRAFARKIDVPAGRLSEILSRKRKLTTNVAQKIAAVLFNSAHVRAQFVQSTTTPKKLPNNKNQSELFRVLKDDEFSLIADWENFAILTLLETDTYKSQTQWIAARLGISTVQVELSLDRLSRLGLIKKNDDKFTRVGQSITTTHDVPSAILKKSHEQTLRQTIDLMYEVPVELRDITSIAIPTDPQKLAEAKKAIYEMRRKIATILRDGKKTEVYNLNIQLVPVTRSEK